MNFNKIYARKTIKIVSIILLVYFFLAGILCYLMDEQLYFRSSKGNISNINGTAGSIELIKNSSIEQEFVSDIQVIDSFSLQIATFARENSGNIKIELLDKTADDFLITSKILDVSQINDFEVLNIDINPYYENGFHHTLKIRITSDNCEVGSSISPMVGLMSTQYNNIGDFYINGTKTPNFVLAFGINGKDKILIGSYYVQIVLIGAAILIIIFLITIKRYQKGKKVYVIDAVRNLVKYKFLIKQLVSRDFKTKYKRSILGILWSFLNPFLIMFVQYIIFSTLFKSDIPYYHIYLLIGIISFNFFMEVCNMCMMSILGNASLITKVYLPKYIYPFTKTLSSIVNFLISLLPLLLMVVFSGLSFSKSYFLVIIPMISMFIFSFGVGLMLCTSMVFFRDTQFLWSVFGMLWMYATPLFYPITILPESVRFLFNINPMYHFITFIRTCIIDGVSPEPIVYVYCISMAFISLFMGMLVFKKNQDKFIYNI